MPLSTREFRAIVALYDKRVYGQALRVLGNPEDAEEATQDVFLVVHRSAKGDAGETSLSTWIYNITFNICGHYLRRNRLRSVPLDEEALMVPDPKPDPEQALIKKDAANRVETLISLLPIREAEAVTLYYLEESSYKEIAGSIDVSEGQVASLIHRGRLHLKSRFQAASNQGEKEEINTIKRRGEDQS